MLGNVKRFSDVASSAGVPRDVSFSPTESERVLITPVTERRFSSCSLHVRVEKSSPRFFEMNKGKVSVFLHLFVAFLSSIGAEIAVTFMLSSSRHCYECVASLLLRLFRGGQFYCPVDCIRCLCILLVLGYRFGIICVIGIVRTVSVLLMLLALLRQFQCWAD